MTDQAQAGSATPRKSARSARKSAPRPKEKPAAKAAGQTTGAVPAHETLFLERAHETRHGRRLHLLGRGEVTKRDWSTENHNRKR